MNEKNREIGCAYCTEMHLRRCPDAFKEVAQYCGNYDHRLVVPIGNPRPDAKEDSYEEM